MDLGTRKWKRRRRWWCYPWWECVANRSRMHSSRMVDIGIEEGTFGLFQDGTRFNQRSCERFSNPMGIP